MNVLTFMTHSSFPLVGVTAMSSLTSLAPSAMVVSSGCSPSFTMNSVPLFRLNTVMGADCVFPFTTLYAKRRF